LRRYSNEFGKDIRSIAPETLERLRSYRWPGNVRELESVMKQSLLTARGNVLLPDFLPPLGDEGEAHLSAEHSEYLSEQFVAERLAAGTDNLYDEAISRAERQLFRQVLAHTSGNQFKAAMLLGISRVTLRSKLKQLGIEAVDFSEGK
jgi:two-component system nitrogen regulation response regulator GlnG